jgi:hypothetical protein
MMPRSTGLAHGLVISSEMFLEVEREAPTGRPVDLAVSGGSARRVGPQQPPGPLLAQAIDPDTLEPFFTAVRTGDRGALLRVHGVCDAVVDPTLDSVTFHPDPSADAAMVPVIAAGMVTALVLMLRGRLVLHASAVEFDGLTVALLGGSGMGKSTVAALCCAAGARLMADDVLRVDLNEDRPVAHAGSMTLRIRPTAAGLADLFDRSANRSADGRVLLRPSPSPLESATLDAVVVPLRAAGATYSLRWVEGANRFLTLLRFPRIVGMCDPDVTSEQFGQLGALAGRVAVAVAELPWGATFDRAIGARLLRDVAERRNEASPGVR